MSASWKRNAMIANGRDCLAESPMELAHTGGCVDLSLLRPSAFRPQETEYGGQRDDEARPGVRGGDVLDIEILILR